MNWQAPRVHLARCDYCAKKIAWSRRRRQWLALAPLTTMHGTQLGRRMTCPSSPNGRLHDPQTTALDFAVALLRGRRRSPKES